MQCDLLYPIHWALFLLLLGATHSVPHSSMTISAIDDKSITELQRSLVLCNLSREMSNCLGVLELQCLFFLFFFLNFIEI